MVSHRFCDRLTEGSRDASSLRVVVVGDEHRPAYDRVNLTRILFGESPEALELAARSWYEARGIELVTGDRVVAIDVGTRHVRTSLGRCFAYDDLVLATGSRPRIPAIAGLEHDGVFEYRTAEDLASIRAAAMKGRRAVVLGGGVLGLEAARSLADLGLATTVVEAGDRLLGRQLGPESADVLRQRVEASGIAVELGHVAKAIEAANPDDEARLRVQLEDDAVLWADLVVLAVGVVPRDELAQEAGIACARHGGILVDGDLRTSDPHVFAIGECAAFEGATVGFVAPGYAMADVIAERLRGGHPLQYRPGLARCELKGVGIDVTTLGEVTGRGERVIHRNAEGIRVLTVCDGRVTGAASVGPWPGLAHLSETIARGRRVGARALQRFAAEGELSGVARLPVAAWPAERWVCNCMRVTRGQLTAALSTGARCPAALTEMTGAGALCGSCEPLLDELCGGDGAGRPAGRRAVWVASGLAGVFAASVLVLDPVPFATSVQAPLHAVDELWRSSAWKQASGFGLLGLSLAAASIALRKRYRWFSWGAFGSHRVFHTMIGTLALLLTVVHTGLRLGHNLNFALMMLFLALAMLGAATGWLAHLEAGSGATATRARWWRPWLARAHWVATWPLAILLGFHVLTAYYF